MKGIPRYLIPAYFDVIVTGTYELLTAQVLNLMPRFVVYLVNLSEFNPIFP